MTTPNKLIKFAQVLKSTTGHIFCSFIYLTPEKQQLWKGYWSSWVINLF